MNEEKKTAIIGIITSTLLIVVSIILTCSTAKIKKLQTKITALESTIKK